MNPTSRDDLIDETDPRLTAKYNRPDPDERPSDEKGRIDVRYMSMEEKVNEIVLSMRKTEDMVSGFIDSMETNPMMKGIARMIGGGR